MKGKHTANSSNQIKHKLTKLQRKRKMNYRVKNNTWPECHALTRGPEGSKVHACKYEMHSNIAEDRLRTGQKNKTQVHTTEDTVMCSNAPTRAVRAPRHSRKSNRALVFYWSTNVSTPSWAARTILPAMSTNATASDKKPLR